LSEISGQGFRFEHTMPFGEREHAALNRLPPPTRRGRIVTLGAGALGLVLLAVSRWTAPLGVVLMLAAALFWFTPRIGRRGAREDYVRARYLHGLVTFGVDERGLWFQGGALRSESAWAGLAFWERRGDRLLLAAEGMPVVVLPVAALREAGVYERVLALAQAHGVEFDSPEAYRRRPRPVVGHATPHTP
jgi:hypothetical protein